MPFGVSVGCGVLGVHKEGVLEVAAGLSFIELVIPVSACSGGIAARVGLLIRVCIYNLINTSDRLFRTNYIRNFRLYLECSFFRLRRVKSFCHSLSFIFSREWLRDKGWRLRCI